MNILKDVGTSAIESVIVSYPAIGEILEHYGIGCVTCKVGICLLKDVVAIHGLPAEEEACLEVEINNCLQEKGESL